MNVNFQYAVLTFNSDLTDPLGEAIPVGVIAVGELTPTHRFCFVAAAHRSTLRVQADSFGLLTDLGDLLGKLTRAGLKQVGHAGLLEWLGRSLGHTLALGQPIHHSVSLTADSAQFDELLSALSLLYEEHVPVRGDDVPGGLPAVRFDVMETSA